MGFSSFKKIFQLQPHYLFHSKGSAAANDLRVMKKPSKRKWCQERGERRKHFLSFLEGGGKRSLTVNTPSPWSPILDSFFIKPIKIKALLLSVDENHASDTFWLTTSKGKCTFSWSFVKSQVWASVLSWHKWSSFPGTVLHLLHIYCVS